MNQFKQFLATTGFALVLGLSSHLAAQDNQGGANQAQDPNRASGQGVRSVQGQGLRGMDFQNMDSTQLQDMIRQRTMERYRELLEVENDAEWQIIEARLTKVTEAQRELGANGAGALGGLAAAFGRGGRGGNVGGQGGGGRGGLQALLGQTSAESQALQQAVDSKAATAELKDRLAKFQEARKQKQAALVKAQDELRKILSVRREAIAVLNGLLE